MVMSVATKFIVSAQNKTTTLQTNHSNATTQSPIIGLNANFTRNYENYLQTNRKGTEGNRPRKTQY
jgi:hypothetical protein